MNINFNNWDDDLERYYANTKNNLRYGFCGAIAGFIFGSIVTTKVIITTYLRHKTTEEDIIDVDYKDITEENDK